MSIKPMEWLPPQPGMAVDASGELRWIRLPVPALTRLAAGGQVHWMRA